MILKKTSSNLCAFNISPPEILDTPRPHAHVSEVGRACSIKMGSVTTWGVVIILIASRSLHR